MTPTSPPSYTFLEEPSNVISNIIHSLPIAIDAHHPSPTITLVDTPQSTTNTDASQPNNNEPNNTEPATPPTPTISNSQPQSHSKYGVNVDETFSLVVKLGTIQTVLSLATSRHWPVHQLNVKNAFLHGDLSKTGKYAAEILERAYMVNCNPSRTLVDTESKLGDDGDPTSDPALYRSLVGSLHVETEYCGVANAIAETCRLRNLLRELHTHLSSATLVYCDNVSAVYLSANPIQHQLQCANACFQMQAANAMCICNLQMQCVNACLQMQAANAMYKCNVHMQAANAMCKLQ
ncbi:ribonuclease H-like domain-containing protein [Tanacetum coccineum]